MPKRTIANTPQPSNHLLKTLQARFEKHPDRHDGLQWADVASRLSAMPEKLQALAEMERTGGEPEIVAHEANTGRFVFFDCAAESPKGRRSVCYDRAGLDSRKSFPPVNTAVEMAAAMGVEILTEAQYFALQQLGDFDTKTSSWLWTPPEIRKLGGALIGDRRYGRAFIYPNGAGSYYGVRGFRACLRV